MANEQNLERGRASFAQKARADAYRFLDAAGRSGTLVAEDWERLAQIASLTGCDAESEAAWARAHQWCLDRGDVEASAGAQSASTQRGPFSAALGAAAVRPLTVRTRL